MRSLTVIKDEEGKIKVTSFGNYRQCAWADEPIKPDSQLIDEFRDYLVKFTLDKCKMKKLSNNVKNVGFYAAKDSSDFYRFFMSNRKQDIEIRNKFFDDRVGIYVLDNLINTNTTGLKLHNYTSRMSDPMFVDILFIIDFQQRYAEIFVHGRSYERIDFDSKTLSSTEKKIVAQVEKEAQRNESSPPNKNAKEMEQSGRVGLW